ncbi:uncharacterized protein METZ01_LOCUS406968 [marine metagenome]|uniref:Uncharacterized protein n=1 Tax=marine metagenome TaxID=408172 RepID=A0A382W620_9ZZZZ
MEYILINYIAQGLTICQKPSISLHIA